jgi:hypothetical protein
MQTGKRRDYEPSDVRAVPILAAAAGLAVVLAVVILVLLPWRHEPSATPALPEAGPALLPHPAANLTEYRAAKTRRLEGYGWIDRDAGIARIPVERAMAILSRGGAASPRPPQGDAP